MKKIYQTPTIKTAVIRVESILAGSTVSVYGDANENGEVLSRRHSYWDDEDDEY